MGTEEEDKTESWKLSDSLDFEGPCKKSGKPVSTNVFLIGFPRGHSCTNPPLGPQHMYYIFQPVELRSSGTELFYFIFFNEVHLWYLAKSYSEKKKLIYFPFLISLGKDDAVCHYTEILLKTFPA